MSDDEYIMNNTNEYTDDAKDEEYKDWKNVYFETVTASRDLNLTLPDTVTVLEKPCGSKVYIVGTAHFSEESIADVIHVRMEFPFNFKRIFCLLSNSCHNV